MLVEILAGLALIESSAGPSIDLFFKNAIKLLGHCNPYLLCAFSKMVLTRAL